MQCGDLERYLEAFLDGRLGRSRSAILRRHLTLCGGCRARIERLRQFERDLQRRFRSMDQQPSIWQGLELDLVASSGRGTIVTPILALPRLLPSPKSEAMDTPPPPKVATAARTPASAPRRAQRSRRGSRLAGVVLVGMAIGALYQIIHPYVLPSDDADAMTRAYGSFLQANEAPPLALATSDPGEAEGWLADRLGGPVQLPETPSGFELMGAGGLELSSGAVGSVAYRSVGDSAGGGTLLLISSEGIEPLPLGKSEAAGGLHELAWTSEGRRYTLFSRLTPEALEPFAP